MKRFLTLCLVAGTFAICALGMVGCGCEHPNIDGGKVVSTTATCTQAGVETVECPACGETQEREVAAYGHSYLEIDEDGNSFRGDGENWHCRYCKQPLIVLSCEQTLPAEVTTTFHGNNNTVYTANIQIESVTLGVYSSDRVTLKFQCKLTSESNNNAYLGFRLKMTDQNDPSKTVNWVVRYGKGSMRPQEIAVKAGDEFELSTSFDMHETDFAGNRYSHQMQEQFKIKLEFSDLTLSPSDL